MVQEAYHIPRTELEFRWNRVRAALEETAPQASGLLVAQRMHLYWLCGTLAMGVFWLPKGGEPVLFVRKAAERAGMESRVKNVVSFKSFSQLGPLAAEAGSPFGDIVAVHAAGFSWQMGQMLASRAKGVEFVPGDQALAIGQAVKSEFELDILRRCGAKHHEGLHELLPAKIAPGMSELDISHAAWEVFFSQGHMGNLRMQAFGEEIFLGNVSVADSGNYPSAFNGPLGVVGVHPSIPYMGSAEIVWEKGQVLGCDIGFSLEGYCTDKTQVYFAGKPSQIPDEVRRAHDFCMEVQALVAHEARPGNTPEQVYLAGLELAEKRGMAEGFMGLGDNQVPFVGHGIGVAIDMFPPLAKGFDRPLEPGMTLAVEPKQGVPGVGMVGVENTFEVRENGAVCITGDAYDILCVG